MFFRRCNFANKDSQIVKEKLLKSGFLPNKEESLWVVCKVITWLGVTLKVRLLTLVN